MILSLFCAREVSAPRKEKAMPSRNSVISFPGDTHSLGR
jgi:hypothetical protein